MHLFGSPEKHKNSSKHSIEKIQEFISLQGGCNKNTHIVNIICDSNLRQDENNEF